jgi:type IV pilus assembly protein PilN
MIYINLLPVREIKRRKKAKNELAGAIGIFISIIILLSSIAFYQSMKKNDLLETDKKIQNEKQQYVKILNDIKKIEEEKKDLQTKIGIIHKLKQSSSLTVRALDEVAAFTPANRMWLKTLTQNANQLSLTGMALDDQTIAKYMDDLEKSKYLQNVTLVNSTMEKFAERDLKAFSVSCTVSFEQK